MRITRRTVEQAAYITGAMVALTAGLAVAALAALAHAAISVLSGEDDWWPREPSEQLDRIGEDR